jgi:DNA gyrase subunit A
LTTRDGKTIIFNEKEIRPTGRASMGVKGITLENNNEVVAADAFTAEEFKKSLFVIGERGIGKKTILSAFKDQHRGGKGVKVASVDDKMGKIAIASIIDPGLTEIIITSTNGQIVKIPLKSIPVRSRTAKGVILMRFSQKDDKVGAATFI